MPEDASGGDRRGLSDEDWFLEELEAWAADPLSSSCPPEYEGVPLAQILAETSRGRRGRGRVSRPVSHWTWPCRGWRWPPSARK